MTVTRGNYDGGSSNSPDQFLNRTMAISNELSSDVAVAILAKQKSPQELQQLKDVILQVHSALQKISEETHYDRLKRQPEQSTKKS